jgi:cytidine deaminase
METLKHRAIIECLLNREKAILLPNHNTKVGASIYTVTNEVFSGYNIQNRCHKSYHAEEIALLNCILHGVEPGEIMGIVISFNDTIDRITFMCGHCRQLVWEYTRNPDLLVTEVDLEGNIIKEKTLKELYPDPYPR